jgi:hypothetical protein
VAMQSRGLLPDRRLFSVALGCLSRNPRAPELLWLLRHMRACGVCPDLRVYHVALSGLRRAGLITLTLTLTLTR